MTGRRDGGEASSSRWSHWSRPAANRLVLVLVLVLALTGGWSASTVRPPSVASAAPTAVAPARTVTHEPPAGHVALTAAPAQTVELTLPFTGVWGVLQGMDLGRADPRPPVSTHVGYAAYAIDFVPAERLTGRPVVRRRLADFPCFGRDILAAAPGTVVWAEDGAPDGAPPLDDDAPALARGRRGSAGARRRRPKHDPGNFVIVEHAPAELTEYRHLQRGSVGVKVGMRVQRGQVLGRCGSSGNAGTPHLHLGFLGSVDPIATRPMRLARYEELKKDGTWTPGDGVPAAGVILRPAAPPGDR